MINFQEAFQIVLNTAKDFGIQSVPMAESIHRVLREDLYADRDFPPFNRVTMDGIAIRYADFEQGTRDFPIAGIAAAGAPQQHLTQAHHCLEVMTGAMLPQGTDTVIRYEDTVTEESVISLQVEQLKQGQNIHRQGEDRAQGSLITSAGKAITAAEIGVAATVGKAQVLVSRFPKTMIISTGDELVEVQESPLPHQIRRSNVYSLQATFTKAGITPQMAHLDDDYETIIKELAEILSTQELIILSGGVSKGKYDYLPQALEELGVKKYFHKVKQRPGKPFWFGESPTGSLIFALPGNPVSSFMCAHRYILPWLRRSIGMADATQPWAILQEEFHFKPDLTLFLQVRVSYNDQGQILAFPITGNGSGDLASLVDADAFIQLPEGQNSFPVGSIFPIFFYR